MLQVSKDDGLGASDGSTGTGALYDDVVAAMSITTKITKMISKRGGKWQAADQAEVVAGEYTICAVSAREEKRLFLFLQVVGG